MPARLGQAGLPDQTECRRDWLRELFNNVLECFEVSRVAPLFYFGGGGSFS
jgi:hypothetical protein